MLALGLLLLRPSEDVFDVEGVTVVVVVVVEERRWSRVRRATPPGRSVKVGCCR